MKAKHIVIGVAAVAVVGLAALNYGYEFAYGNGPKDLCAHLGDFTYADAVRDVETKFSMQDFVDMIQWQFDQTAPKEKAKVTCHDISEKDGKQLYAISAGKISKKFIFGVKEGKTSTALKKKYVAAVIRVIDDDGKTIENGFYWMKLMDWIPAQMEQHRIEKKVDEIENSK